MPLETQSKFGKSIKFTFPNIISIISYGISLRRQVSIFGMSGVDKASFLGRFSFFGGIITQDVEKRGKKIRG